MVYNLTNLKNEFKRYILESKSYDVDYFSGKIADMIYVCGLLMTLAFINGSLTLDVTLRLLMWYILYNTSLNAVSDGEFEIRADFLKNLTYTKTSIWSIYFNRLIVYGLEAIIVFALSLILMSFFITVDFALNINLLNLLAYLGLTIGVNIALYYFLMSLTFIFERTMTFASLLMTFMLFISGMVFSFNATISNLLFGRITNFLSGTPTVLPFLVVGIGLLLTYLFTKYTEGYLRKN